VCLYACALCNHLSPCPHTRSHPPSTKLSSCICNATVTLQTCLLPNANRAASLMPLMQAFPDGTQSLKHQHVTMSLKTDCESVSLPVQSPFGFGGPCAQQTAVAIPTINPQWSCGLVVNGNFTCTQSEIPFNSESRLRCHSSTAAYAQCPTICVLPVQSAVYSPQ